MRGSTWFYLLLIVFILNSRSLLCNEDDEEEKKVKNSNGEDNDESASKNRFYKCFKNYFDKTAKNENNENNNDAPSSSCFGRMSSSLEREKPGTQWNSKEVEQLLAEKLLKYWRKNNKKFKAPRKLCSKLKQQREGTDIHGFFSTKLVRVVQSKNVGYEVHRVQLSDHNEGGKDMCLLACHCEKIKIDSDTDSDIAVEQLPNYDFDDEESDPERNEFDQPYTARPSTTDPIENFYGPKVTTDRLSDTDSTITPPQDESHNLPYAISPLRRTHNRKLSEHASMLLSSSRKFREVGSPSHSSDYDRRTPNPKFSHTSVSLSSSRKLKEIDSPSLSPDYERPAPNPKFSRASMSLSSSRKLREIECPSLSPDHETTRSSFKSRQRPLTPLFRRQTSGKFRQRDELLSLTDFNTTLLEFPRSSRSSRTGLGSNESQFSHFKQNGTPDRYSITLDYSKIGIPPTFNRWIIKNAKEVPAANICVNKKMYISRGVSGRSSFFLYAKNLENDIFNVIGHFKL